MRELPKGWQETKLADVANLKTGPFGSALHKSDYMNGGVPLINPTHIRAGNLIPADDVAVSEETSRRLSEYRLNQGDIVMGRRGEMGRCAVVPPHAHGWLCGTGSVIIKSSEAIEPAYLQRFLTAPETVATLIGDSVGSTMVNLNQGVLLGLDIPVAPLPEQKRIADKLDSVLARVDACRDRLDRIPALLKRFRQSILAAATSGRLTEDWRTTRSPDEAQRNPGSATPDSCAEAIDNDRNSDLPCGWRSVTFSDVCREITVGYVGKMSDQYRESGIPFLRSMNVRAFRFDPKGLLHISREFHQQTAKSVLRPGDLAVVRSGAPGICCVIPEELTEANCSDLVIARPGPELVPQYGCIFMNSTFAEDFVRANKVGVAQAHFNVGSMKITPLPLPSTEEQHEIVRRVETLFAFADRLEVRLATARKQAGQLTPALLAKAFRGELVPQDPKDEPATELLKRLATERNAAPKATRGRKPSAK